MLTCYFILLTNVWVCPVVWSDFKTTKAQSIYILEMENVLVSQITHSEAHRSAIILKFFIHKLDASLQITVHGQNFFKWKMRNKRKPKRANGARLSFLFVCVRKWIDNWDKWICSTHCPVREACKSLHHGMTIELNVPSDQSFGILEEGNHSWMKACVAGEP